MGDTFHTLMHVLIVGGTGMVGRRMIPHLLGAGHQVTVSSRSANPKGLPDGVETVQWDTDSPFPHEGPFDAIVSVTGASLIDKRWTPEYKKELRRSRVTVNKHLVDWIDQAQPQPRVFVSSNAVGIYGRSPAGQVTEESPPGDDFLARLCVEWEKQTMAAHRDRTRAVSMRQGVVLDKEGDALEKMLPIFKLGLGGPVGNGKQPVPWVSSHDLARMFVTAIEDERYQGPVNAVAPAQNTNRDLTKALADAVNRPAVFPVPPFMLQLLYGEAAQVITDGQAVVPKRAKDLGFTWDHASLNVAVKAALEKEQQVPPRKREGEITRSA